MELLSESPVLGEAAFKRFVLNSTLLCLIDNVRGDPTTHTIDKHPHDDASPQAKFLDSFALICSTSKGSETASAVCLEQGLPTGTVVRLARNMGTSEEELEHFQEILDDLADIASKATTPEERATEIMSKIVNLAREKIDSIIAVFQRAGIRKAVEEALQKLQEMKAFSTTSPDFVEWVGNLHAVSSIEAPATTDVLIGHIKWAVQARWIYSTHLEELLCDGEEEMPGWVNFIYKLGRYYVAMKAMIKLATKQPELFLPIQVKSVRAPKPLYFSIEDEQTPLRTTIQKVTEVEHENLIEQLGKLWLRDNPEAHFRKKCSHRLTAHAEMQLLSFYDHNPEIRPLLLFMGTSKKACFMCNRFMSRHELGMTVSACHQKLYPSWMPAPSSNSGVRKAHRKLMWDISQYLEQTVGRDLESRLGIRRKRTHDSTAGPSDTSVTWRESLAFREKPQNGSDGEVDVISEEAESSE